ncbi:MAG: hypothetical protein JXM73_06940 [Anaerolineae bacterium]|nr:hypothetical protein [Anaerolineae bacterium]
MSNVDPDAPQATTLRIFNEARRRAFVQDMLAEVGGRPDSLLSFDEVRRQFRLGVPNQEPVTKEVPLDKIVGSVGRYHDFNRAFLPRAQVDPHRWTRIARLQRQSQLPPIDLFQVGDVYFVRDGHHRVSVARTLKHRTIRAHVVEIPLRVPLDTTTSPGDLIRKAEYADFLEKTSLDRTHPEQRVELTLPGRYISLLQHIEVHQFYMGLRSRKYPTLPEAANNWYCSVYLPVVERIRASGVLANFPGRTEADLYLWISENRARLQMRYGDNTQVSEAVQDFSKEHHVPSVRRAFRRWLYRLFPRRRPYNS